MALYDKAIESAQERECLRVSAIAWERAGEFYLALGRQKVAQTYLKEARYAYLRWGSTPKVRDLEAKYPQVLDSISAKGTAQDASKYYDYSITGSRDSQALDLTTVVKASQAISGKIKFAELLESLMQCLVENSGAQKAFLLLYEKEKLKVKTSIQAGGELISGK
ncbi:hypothetical protein [Phormidium sp. CCY1219]|uniref:hypothetical protein n=1 Tax=Phormidium sp. CCY1219 TaxID=2886104 RepID=UPI002D1E7880|nr:hypothetical protein [Phormidium sp. CCY1219]MEB3826807.1 hypothetical protein [Phormidium sp. CCY1219]